MISGYCDPARAISCKEIGSNFSEKFGPARHSPAPKLAIDKSDMSCFGKMKTRATARNGERHDTR